MILSICGSLVSTGLMFILPFLFDNLELGLKEVLYMTLAGFPSLIVDYLLVDNKDVGRLKLLSISFFF